MPPLNLVVRRLFIAMLYDTIGRSYRTRRVPDPRIESAINHALGESRSVVNIGAGTGSYEPSNRSVLAIEPSMTMIRQRPTGSAPAIQALAEHLPLRDKCVSAAMAILTMHHWRDVTLGLSELLRVARDRIVILTYDPKGPGFWLTNEYFPNIAEDDRRKFPTLSDIERTLGGISVQDIPVPKDCIDGFLGAYWARPSSYLDPEVRSGISAFSNLPNLSGGLDRLRGDLANGTWHRNFGHLEAEETLDLGYRLVIANVQ